MSTENKTRLIKALYFIFGLAIIYATAILLKLDFTTLASVCAFGLVVDNRIDAMLTHQAYMIMFDKFIGKENGTDDSNS